MHAKSSLLVAPSSTVWSICSQLFAERTILQGLIDNFHLDLLWWLEFFQSPCWAPIPDLHVSSDATTSVGYGAPWFAVSITDALIHCLFLIVLAASLWGHQWSAKQVKFCSDNTAVVEVLWSSTSRDLNLKALLRHLSLLAARHSFAFTAHHISGKSNFIVDTIPRFEFQRFHQLAPYASPTATPVPPLVLAKLPVV